MVLVLIMMCQNSIHAKHILRRPPPRKSSPSPSPSPSSQPPIRVSAAKAASPKNSAPSGYPPPPLPYRSNAVAQASTRCSSNKFKESLSFRVTLVEKNDWANNQLGETWDEAKRIRALMVTVKTCNGKTAADEYVKSQYSSDYIICFHGSSAGRPCTLAYLLAPFIEEFPTFQLQETDCC